MKNDEGATGLTNFATPRDWAGRWIWHSQAGARNAWVLFRSEFEVNTPDGARLFISADTRYRVWVNGVRLGDGPPQSQPYHQYYDERDLSALLNAGVNCIAVVVNHQGVQDSARGGLLAEVVDGSNRSLCASGPDWQSLVGTAWRSNAHFEPMNRIGPFQEHVDQRKMPTRPTRTDRPRASITIARSGRRLETPEAAGG